MKQGENVSVLDEHLKFVPDFSAKKVVEKSLTLVGPYKMQIRRGRSGSLHGTKTLESCEAFHNHFCHSSQLWRILRAQTAKSFNFQIFVIAYTAQTSEGDK